MSQRHVAATKICLLHPEGHVAGTKSQHLHKHENVAGTCPRDMLQQHVPSCELTARYSNDQHALRPSLCWSKMAVIEGESESVEENSPAYNRNDSV